MDNPKLEDRFNFADEFDRIMENNNLKIQSVTKEGDFKIKADLSIFAFAQIRLDSVIGNALENVCKLTSFEYNKP